MDKHSFQIWSPQLRNWRTLDVYLPESYDLGRLRYPAVYMQDGQNLSDPSIAFAGNTWQLEGALGRLREAGIEPIVVGIHHAGAGRLIEYSPFADPRHGGGFGHRYCRFLIDTVRPRIDAQYRTRRIAREPRDCRLVDGRSDQPVRILPARRPRSAGLRP